MKKNKMTLFSLAILAGFCCTSFAFGQTGENQDEKLIIRQDAYIYKAPCVQNIRTDTFVIERDKQAKEKKKILTGQIPSKLFRSNSIVAIHYFAFDSSRITAADAEKILQSIPPSARQYKLDVIGYTCSIGSAEYNKKLSKQRAQAVAALLSKHGYKIMSIRGAGEVSSNSTLTRSNRKVVIKVR